LPNIHYLHLARTSPNRKTLGRYFFGKKAAQAIAKFSEKSYNNQKQKYEYQIATTHRKTNGTRPHGECGIQWQCKWRYKIGANAERA
jgi:hypothetical protein